MQNNPQAVAFLQCLGGDSFVFQTFTDNKAKKAALKRFDPLARVLIGTFEEHEGTLDFLNKQGAGIFVQINKGIKRTKAAITSINVLVADLDNPPTTASSMKSLKEHMPKPSMVVSTSPGKYHVYWRVTDCPLDQFRKMQLQLAITFHADVEIKNLDRVMRIPGYMHNKGEAVEVKAVLINDGQYTLKTIYDAAKKAPILTPTTNGTAKAEVQQDPLKKDVFGLNIGSDYEVPNKLVHGETSRTQGLFAYGGHLIGKSESLERVIAKVVEFNAQNCEPPLTTSELELEVYPGLRKYVIERDAQAPKQLIAPAPVIPAPPVPTAPGVVPTPPAEVVPTPPPEIKVICVDEYLDRYIYVSDGMRVIDTQGEGQYRIYKEAEFAKDKKGEVLNKKELSKTWMEHEERTTCRGIVWEPGKGEIIFEDNYNFYNSYRPATITPATDEEYDESIALQFLVHFEYMFPEVKSNDHFLNWFCHTVRFPGTHIPWAPLIISDDEGTGKGLMFQMLSQLVGTDNAGTIQLSDVEGNFNDFLLGKSVILLDEMSKPKTQSTVDRLKLYIANDKASINVKGIALREHNIYGNFIIFSNNSDAAYMGASDRRYWVHKMHTLAGAAHFKKIGALFSRLEEGKRVYFDDNLRHFLRWVNDRDLSKFNYLERPFTTESKREMIEDSRSLIEITLNDMIDHRTGIFAADVVAFPLILDALEPLNDRKLSKTEISEVRRILNKRGSSIFSKHPVSPLLHTDNVVHKQYRVRCIRNYDHWSKQGTEAIRHELTRSLQMAVVGNDVLDPLFDLIEGDKDAKSTES